MTMDEYRLIETFFDRCEQLEPDLRSPRLVGGSRMATDNRRCILEKLGSTPPLSSKPGDGSTQAGL